jgi:hypothetical protein
MDSYDFVIDKIVNTRPNSKSQFRGVSQLANVKVGDTPRTLKAVTKVSIRALFRVCTILPSSAARRNPYHRSQQHESSSSPCHAQERAPFVRCDADFGAILIDSIDSLGDDDR